MTRLFSIKKSIIPLIVLVLILCSNSSTVTSSEDSEEVTDEDVTKGNFETSTEDVDGTGITDTPDEDVGFGSDSKEKGEENDENNRTRHRKGRFMKKQKNPGNFEISMEDEDVDGTGIADTSDEDGFVFGSDSKEEGEGNDENNRNRHREGRVMDKQKDPSQSDLLPEEDEAEENSNLGPHEIKRNLKFVHKGPPQWHTVPPEFFNFVDESSMGSSKEVPGKSALKYKRDINKQSHCTDINPAPIDIITKNAEEESAFSEFSFRDYDSQFKFDMFIPEDGTDLLVVKPTKDGTNPAVISPAVNKGSILGRELNFDSMLIRYGRTPDAGSEHFIDGKQMGMELQFIFKYEATNQDPMPYWELAHAVNSHKDANETGNDPNIHKFFVVLCVLVNVKGKSEDVPDAENSEGLIYLSQAARMFWRRYNINKYRAFTSEEQVLSLKQFFDVPNTDIYYTYSGTMTFPPCLPFFRFSVFQKPLVTDYKTWQSFEFVHSEFSDTGFVAGNFRPLQSIYIEKPIYNEDGIQLATELRPYSEFKEEISRTVKKSTLFNKDKDKSDDYDYYEEDSKEFGEGKRRRLAKRSKNKAAFGSSASVLLISLTIVTSLFVY